MAEIVIPASSKAVTTLECGFRWVEGIVDIPSYDLVAVGCQDNKIRIFSAGHTDGKPIRIFNKHKGSVKGLVHLVDDICVSVDWKGILYTWRASTLEIIGELKASQDGCTSMTKVNDTELVIGTREGEIISVSHKGGYQLSRSAHPVFEDTDSKFIREIGAAGNLFVSVGMSSVHVLDHFHDKLLHTFRDEECATCVAVNSKFIVTGGNDEKLYVRDATDASKFALLSTIDLNNFAASDSDIWIIHLMFLNDDIIIVTTQENGSFFVDLRTEKCLSHLLPENSGEVNTAAVLCDGKIAFGGKNGYCALFNPSLEVRPHIAAYNQRDRSPKKTVVTNPRAKSLEVSAHGESSTADDLDSEHFLELLGVVETQEKLLEELRGKVEVMEMALKGIESKSLASKMEELRGKVKKLEGDLVSKKEDLVRETELKRVEFELDLQLKAQGEKMSAMMKDLEMEFEEKINANKNKTAAELVALNKAMKAMETEMNESIRRVLDSSNKAQDEKASKMEKDMGVTWAAMHADLVKKSESTEKRIEDTKAEAKAQDTKLQATEARQSVRNQELEEKIDALRRKVEETEKKARDHELLGIKDEKLKSELVAQDQGIKSMEATMEKRFSEWKTAKEGAMGDIKVLNESVEALKLKMADYTTKKQVDDIALSVVETHIEEMKKDALAKKGQDGDEKIAAVKAQVAEVKKMHQVSEVKSEEMRTEIAALKKSHSEQAATVPKTDESKAEHSVKQVEDEISAKHKLLEEKIRVQTEQYESLGKSHEVVEKKLGRLESLHRTRAKEAKEMQSTMTGQEKEIERMKAELASLAKKHQEYSENTASKREVKLSTAEKKKEGEAKAPARSWFSTLFCFARPRA